VCPVGLNEYRPKLHRILHYSTTGARTRAQIKRGT
jgi:hypothetical protein